MPCRIHRYIMTILALLASFSVAGQADSLGLVELQPDDTVVPVRSVEPFPVRYVVAPVRPDPADVDSYRPKRFWRGAAEVFGFNMSLWAFDRFVQHGEYAYINLHTIKENFRHGFRWDDDYLGTNMFLHPYMGSLYYTGGRANGFNFWQSELFAISGSAMWELFMEKEYPSTNDIIATPVGGAAIGEVLYRTSDIIINDQSSGIERFGRELAVFLVSPVRGFNRLITGRAWRHGSTPGRRFGLPPISATVSLGARMLTMHDNQQTTRTGATAVIDIQYGHKYEQSRTPYDYFSFLMELNAIKTQPFLSRLCITGRLLARDIVDAPTTKMTLGLYQHFDFFDSDTITDRTPDPYRPCAVPYKLGAPAQIGAGLMLLHKPSPDYMFEAYVHGNAVVLAGILTDFYRTYHRNYNWGGGLAVKAGLAYSLKKGKLRLSLDNQFYLIYTKNGSHSYKDMSILPNGQPTGIQGDNSRAWFDHLEARMVYRLHDRLSLTTGVDFYKRKTRYGHILEDGLTTPLPNPYRVNSSQLGLHLMLTYHL